MAEKADQDAMKPDVRIHLFVFCLSLAASVTSMVALFLPNLGQAMGSTFALLGCALYNLQFTPAVGAHLLCTLFAITGDFLLIPRNGDLSRLNFFGAFFVIVQGFAYFAYATQEDVKARDAGPLHINYAVGGLLFVFVDAYNSEYWAGDWGVSRRQGAWCAFCFMRGYDVLVYTKQRSRGRAVFWFGCLGRVACLIVALTAQAWTQAIVLGAVSVMDVLF